MKDYEPIKPTDGGAAVGAYLKYLREAYGLKATEVAERIGTNQAQVWRIDNWQSDTRSSLLFKYIRAVNRDANDIEMLINNRDATPEDGVMLAKLRLGLRTR